MNYAPCKAYNADFDGDEMNGHFVQSFLSQAEAAELSILTFLLLNNRTIIILVNVGNNYLVPKDGTPILGLIQDHIISGVLMTIRGRFFTREDFMHLLLASFAETNKRIQMPMPSILKPKTLWSGKQVNMQLFHWYFSQLFIVLINMDSYYLCITVVTKFAHPRFVHSA